MKRINLLPGDESAKARREQGIVYMLLGLIVLVLVLGAAYVWQNNQVSSKTAELADINSRLSTADQQVAGLAPYRTLEQQRTAMMQSARGIYDSRVVWSSIMQELSLVIPDDVRLQSLTAAVPATMQPGASTGTPATAAASTDVTLSGQAASLESVAVFMTRLGLLPQLTSVNLSDSQEVAASEGQPAYVTYTITASLRPFLTSPPTTVLATGAGQ